MPQEPGHVIVFGNEKGGSGKSTAAMHTAIGLLRLGYRVGTLDLDARQGTLTRYLKNRFHYVERTRKPLPAPLHMAIERSQALTVLQQKDQDYRFLNMALEELRAACDFIVIDTPGADTHLNRMAHARAQTLITPVNDSFIDLDILADLDPETHMLRGPSIYAKSVLELRAHLDVPFRWIVMRNRTVPFSETPFEIELLLEDLQADLGFELCAGFSDRSDFRDLFLKGLTLLDPEEGEESSLTLARLSARQEVRQLIRLIGPEAVKGYPAQK